MRLLAIAFVAGMLLAGPHAVIAAPEAVQGPVAENSTEHATGFSFRAITGGTLDMDAWRGQPVLVVNTASLCGFTGQYDDLQALHERYASRGLVVLAVPSDDFRQELASDREVADFCAINFDLTIPMAGITRVTGPDAHPFYRWLADVHGFAPQWNFNKVLLGGQGELLGTWGSTTRPTARSIRRAVERALAG